MKNFKIIFYSLIISISVISCDEKELDLAPISQLTTGNFYSSAIQIEQALTGAYSELDDLYDIQMIRAAIWRGDNSSQTEGYANNLELNISQYNENAGSEVSTDIWNTCYAIISRTNLVISKSEEIDYAEKTAHLSEARFLRALMYFELARHFGDVPMVIKPVGLEESFTIGRTPVAEVYSFVTSEFVALANASSGLSTKQNNKGRPTIYSALGMAAKAYMAQGNYTSSKPHLKSIIDSGLFSMQANYADIFMESNDNGPHVVFSIQYDGSIPGLGNQQPQQVPKMAAEIPFQGVTRKQIASDDLYDSYEAGDIRRDLTIQNGYTSTEDGVFVEDVRFWNKFAINNTPVQMYQWGVDINLIRYTDVKMRYAEILNSEGYPNAEAFDILNEVRTRAGLPSLTSSDITSQSAFLDAIINERRYEFAGESNRWWDLLRTGKDQAVLSAFALPAYPYKIEKRLFGIPEAEILKVNDPSILPQNPGY
tara:strand:+ start:478 stop:1923 length:1446 start_codon:yes stop_codon:yes gene_type:complete